jgi:hypothetical protein
LAFAAHEIDAHWKLQGYVPAGFANSSPDFGLGGIVGYTF